MPLSEEQKSRLRAEAERRGLDPGRMVAIAEAELEAEEGTASSADTASGKPAGEQPKLFQYHLPFVTVKEVRQRWLGLTEAFPGDGEIAADWAAAHGGGGPAGG